MLRCLVVIVDQSVDYGFNPDGLLNKAMDELSMVGEVSRAILYFRHMMSRFFGYF